MFLAGKGGQPKLAQEQVASLKQLVADGVPKAAAVRKFKISRETVYQYLK